MTIIMKVPFEDNLASETFLLDRTIIVFYTIKITFCKYLLRMHSYKPVIESTGRIGLKVSSATYTQVQQFAEH